MSFEVFNSLLTPSVALGRHQVVFRVNAPGLSGQDVEVLSSRRIPPTGSTETNHLTAAVEEIEMSTTRWVMRFVAEDGAYTVSFALGDAGYGDFQILSGCIVRVPEGPSLQASGCVAERV